jgi:phosphohistidine phosphatase SixA
MQLGGSQRLWRRYNAGAGIRFRGDREPPSSSHVTFLDQEQGDRNVDSQLVVQHLPYLRRYARALTGSQMAGDAYVAATLERW